MPTSAATATPMDFAPYRLSGTVYGTLLNHRSSMAMLGEAVNQAPYKAAPKAPVLYVKPRNTLAVTGAVVSIPADATELEIGACLGVLMGRSASRLSAATALQYVAGYLIVNDISVPHPDYYRPSIRYKARDGFCPLGAATARERIANPNALALRIYVDDKLVHTSSTTELIRSVETLLVDVTEFMTLAAGDVLAVGVAAPAPRVRAGQAVRIECDGLASLESRFVGESP